MKTKRTLLLLVAALSTFPVLLKAQWAHVRYDLYNTYSKVFTVAADTAFVIGVEPMNNENFILRTNDGGTTWDSVHISTAPSFQLTELFFSDANNGFTGGYKNNLTQALLKTTDNGTTWTEITPDPTSNENITAIFFLDAMNGFAASASKLYTTVNGGQTWTSQSVSFNINDLHFSDMNNGYACGTTNTTLAVLMNTTNGGQTWSSSLSTFDSNLFVSSFGKEDILANGVSFTSMLYTNKLFKTTDNGMTWDTIVVDSVFSIHDFQFINADTGHVLSDYGQIFVTKDGGQTWALEYATEWGFYGPNINLFSLSFVGETGYVVGTSGLIKKHSAVTSVNEIENSYGTLNVYPNPSAGSQNLTIQTTDNFENYKLQIVNAFGQVVFTKNDKEEGNSITLSTLNLSPGIYYLSVETKGKRSTQKLMIAE